MRCSENNSSQARRASEAPRGFMLMDLLIGMLLMAALTTVLMVSLHGRTRTAREMAGQRAAMQQAIAVLGALQSGNAPRATQSSEDMKVTRDTARVGSMQWVQVTVRQDGRAASLWGLAPATAPAGGAAP